VLYRRGHLKADARLLARLPRLIAATASMIVALLVGRIFVTAITTAPVFGTATSAAGPELVRVAALSGLIALGAGVFIAAALMLRAVSISDIASLRRRA
jgi:putative peptidoglycan lipid II flippase